MNLTTLVVQSLSCVWLFAPPWTAAHQASLSLTISWSLLKLMFIESVMPSNQLILCRLLQSFPAIFSNESTVGTTYKCNHTVFVLSWLSYLIEHNVIHVVTCVKCSSFLRVNNILVCVSMCINHILFIHLSMDGYFGCCHHLTIQVWPKYVVATTTRLFSYNLSQIPYDYAVEVTNRFKGLDLTECWKNYGWRFITLYRRWRSKPSSRKWNAKRQNGFLRRPYK